MDCCPHLSGIIHSGWKTTTYASISWDRRVHLASHASIHAFRGDDHTRIQLICRANFYDGNFGQALGCDLELSSHEKGILWVIPMSGMIERAEEDPATEPLLLWMSIHLSGKSQWSNQVDGWQMKGKCMLCMGNNPSFKGIMQKYDASHCMEIFDAVPSMHCIDCLDWGQILYSILRYTHVSESKTHQMNANGVRLIQKVITWWW